MRWDWCHQWPPAPRLSVPRSVVDPHRFDEHYTSGSGLRAASVRFKLAQLAQVAWDLCAAKNDIMISHVKAHEGHPWNILADNIAKSTARKLLPEARDLPESWVQAIRFENS
eukprot:6663556-Pyramimonas_sp.AAC.1